MKKLVVVKDVHLKDVHTDFFEGLDDNGIEVNACLTHYHLGKECRMYFIYHQHQYSFGKRKVNINLN